MLGVNEDVLGVNEDMSGVDEGELGKRDGEEELEKREVEDELGGEGADGIIWYTGRSYTTVAGCEYPYPESKLNQGRGLDC
jgi:hypothetical protein